MFRNFLIYTFMFSFVFVVSCTSKKQNKHEEIDVFAAASLVEVLTSLKSEYEHSNAVKLNLNFASSGKLARQIEFGATPNLFISANQKWIDYLLAKKMLLESDSMVKNSLVLVIPSDFNIDSLSINQTVALDSMVTEESKFAIADYTHAPLGIYSKQALEKMNLFQKLENRFLIGQDASVTLKYVELHEAVVGMVYKTAALKSKKVKIVSSIPQEIHQSIVYHKSIVQLTEQANNFYLWLNSEKANEIWQKHGFVTY